ncbi:hypothetical protein V6N13_100169 [Hibiscus sabdariffa]
MPLIHAPLHLKHKDYNNQSKLAHYTVAARLSEVKNNDPKKSWANWDYNILIITMLETSQLSPVPSLPSNLQSLFRVLEHVGKPIYFPNDATPSPWPGH